MKKIPYGRQYIDNSDVKLVSKSLKGRLITTGDYVINFERKVKKYLKCKYVKSCSSGTAALHLAMLSIGINKNDVVLMPAVNFVASYNLAKSMKAKIYFVDVDHQTGQITPNKIEECIKKYNLKKIKILITMMHGGYPENIKKFYFLKKKI